MAAPHCLLLALCCALSLAHAQAPACVAIDSDRILGKHLAAAIPTFAAVPPDTFLGTMPTPGSHHTIHTTELASLAQRYSIRLDPATEVCFEWSMESLDPVRIVEAMRESLHDTDAHIEVAATSPNPVPRGRLEFPREMLGKPATASQKDPVLWRGSVVYGGDHRYGVWAKVRVTTACSRLIAIEALKAGEKIDPRQVRTEQAECFPSQDGSRAILPASLSGLVPSRAVAAGSIIPPEILAPPNDVNRGDTVHVEVRSGAARLAFVAKAESAGRNGDWIAVRNPSSNKIFRARVAGKDQVLVPAESDPGNP